MYGLQLPVQALSVRTSMPWEHEGSDVDDMVRVAQACDDAGFFYVAVCHHVAIPREPAEMMSTQWFDPVPTLAYLAARHDAHALDDERVRRRVPASAADREGVRDARPALRTAGSSSASASATSRASSTCSACRSRDRGALTDEAIDAITDALTDEWPVHDGARFSFKDVGQRPASGATAAPADLDRRFGQARAAARRGAWRRVDPAGHARASNCPTTSRTSCATATRCDPARCPRSATSPSTCTSASPTGTSASTRSPDHRRRSSTRSTRSARSVSAICSCASRRGPRPSSATRSRRSATQVGPHLTRTPLT